MQSDRMMLVNQNVGIVLNDGRGSNEYFMEYDEQQRITRYWEKDTGYEENYVYNEDGTCICTGSDDTIQKLDEEGRVLYQESDGYKQWAEYNEFGKSVHYKDSDGFEEFGEYDSNGNLIYLKDYKGREERWVYDGESRLLSHRREGCLEESCEYWENGNLKKRYYGNKFQPEKRETFNEHGQLTHSWSRDGTDEWREYDEKGRLLYQARFSRFECRNEYDDAGNLIHTRNSYGYEKWQQFDSVGNCIHTRDSNGNEERFSYNESNQVTEYKDGRGRRYRQYYDTDGKLLSKQTDGCDEYYTYDENNNLLHYKCEEKEEE